MSNHLPPFTLQPIGKIWTGFKSREECPRNSRFNKNQSIIEVDPAYADAFLGLEVGRHIAVLYWFDKADRTKLQTTPPNADKLYGVFTTRSPHRPNPIALSAVEILAIDGTKLTVSGLDCIDGTPLLDIKIYVPMIDAPQDALTSLPWSNKP
ncbi:tRNA (N6-threonylcarbamoyladenosine(37)-N6)-methyltransferase TrmO [uncultured Cohaesibacter sp.]|uniref:tRNA (N6-threonylcarbamoyladenosine(37)-N6)-methyltransferase TrmO n=1 Tax=uncultured Cohaesibacter sp. TaxID=1002546 RepID=UPI00292EF4CE|nr:tRNA (N6-threonylcarbamoyladenosine(37)-N6)-methyltransferase TrmO [uncultured Cohaesibacter sp.]